MIKLTLDTTLQKLNISRYELAKRTGIQYQIIDNYYKNRVKRYDSDVLDRICTALGCGIEDIIEYSKIITTSKLVVCTAPIRGAYWLSP